MGRMWSWSMADTKLSPREGPVPVLDSDWAEEPRDAVCKRMLSRHPKHSNICNKMKYIAYPSVKSTSSKLPKGLYGITWLSHDHLVMKNHTSSS